MKRGETGEQPYTAIRLSPPPPTDKITDILMSIFQFYYLIKIHKLPQPM
jgi:hypothetical protein